LLLHLKLAYFAVQDCSQIVRRNPWTWSHFDHTHEYVELWQVAGNHGSYSDGSVLRDKNIACLGFASDDLLVFLLGYIRDFIQYYFEWPDISCHQE